MCNCVIHNVYASLKDHKTQPQLVWVGLPWRTERLGIIAALDVATGFCDRNGSWGALTA
jgi:hypothetical protein